MENLLREITSWANQNSGFLSLIIFLLTLLLGWVTGIFKTLMQKPNLKVEVIPGPTMVTSFETGRKFNENNTYRTAISLYLKIVNTGSAPTDIDRVEVGYHNHSFKYTFLWFWLEKPHVSLSDFRIKIGDSEKVFPFLFQQSFIALKQTETYLEIGKKATGVVYFEQQESWGGFQPRVNDNKVKVKIKVVDAFGRSYTLKTRIPFVSKEEAQKYNPEFGNSLESLNEQNT